MNRFSDVLPTLERAAQVAMKGPAAPGAATVTCSGCDGTGWIPVVVDGVRRVKRCQTCVERLRGTAPGVPTGEAAATLDAYGQTLKLDDSNAAAVAQARYFVEGVHPGLYIHGGVGTGKTALACAVLNDCHKAGQGVRFCRVTDLLRSLVQPDGDQQFAKLAQVPVLVLDDVGAQKGSDYARAALVSLYEKRTDNNHRTVWTSNLDLDELADFMGEDARLSSRIAGGAKVISLDGRDYRMAQARKRAKS